MNSDWRVDLLRTKKYSDLFEDTYMFDPPLGWKDIVTCLVEYIAWHNQVHKSDITIWSCTKENGGLRFQIDHRNSDRENIGEIYGAIQFAEMISSRTCERCSKSGKFHKINSEGNLLLASLCDEHYEEIINAIQKSTNEN